MQALFPETPFESDYFKAFSRNAAGTLPPRLVFYLLVKNQWVGFGKTILAVNKLYRVLRCSGFKKFVNAEDIYTTLLNNDIVELKMPTVWIDQWVINVSPNGKMGFNQPKLFVALGTGFMEYFTTSSDEVIPLDKLEEERNVQCVTIRD